jgi:hypothetical protein
MKAMDNPPNNEPTEVVEKKTYPKWRYKDKFDRTEDGQLIDHGGTVFQSGRFPSQLDEDVVYQLAMVNATAREIADAFGTSETIFYKTFRHVYMKARARMKIELRAAQMASALGGNPALLKHMGKHVLDQHDSIKISGALDSVVMEMSVEELNEQLKGYKDDTQE